MNGTAAGQARVAVVVDEGRSLDKQGRTSRRREREVAILWLIFFYSAKVILDLTAGRLLLPALPAGPGMYHLYTPNSRSDLIAGCPGEVEQCPAVLRRAEGVLEVG